MSVDISSDAILFWSMVVVQSGLIIWFVETRNLVASAVTLLTLMAGLCLFPGTLDSMGFHGFRQLGVAGWLRANVWNVLSGVGLYLLIGMAWAVFRWWLFVSCLRDDYECRKRDWLRPAQLQTTAALLRSRSEYAPDPALRRRLSDWAEACQGAALHGGQQLTRDLKPVWKEFVENGFQL